MISAQIKRGNSFLIDSLEDTLLQIINLPQNKPIKPIKYSFFQFICLIADLATDFARSPYPDLTFNLFLIDHHISKYQKGTEIYRHFIGLTQSWKKFLDIHEDAKLFLSLLNDNRNTRSSVKQFIKIRKTILKTLNQKILSEISITHSDALTICHQLYEGSEKLRISKKINQLFISLKRKLINTAKVDGAVACEFFLNAGEEVKLKTSSLKQNKNMLSINHQQELGQKHQYPNNVSFSEQYASCYRPQGMSERQNEIGSIQQLDFEWQSENKTMFGFPQAQMSLKKLFEKDRNIDEKLKGSGIMKEKDRFPDGWEDFLMTNRIMKEKLLNHKIF